MKRGRALILLFGWLSVFGGNSQALPVRAVGGTPAAVARPNIVLITIDTLRSDRLGCYGYSLADTPNMDRLASEGIRFKTAVAQVPLTLPSHATILTGSLPTVHGVRDNVGYKLGPEQRTLAELLKSAGYGTAAFVGSYVLNSRFGLNQGFDRYDDVPLGSSAGVVNLNELERPAAEVVDKTIAWLKTTRATPFLVWVHLYDPHDPYRPPEPFGARFKSRPYDGEVAYCDQQIGRLTAFLKDQGLYDRSTIVLTSDHGESFGEHQEFTHGFFLYDTTLLVPLIIKPSAALGPVKEVSSQVSTVDIFPTVLQIANVAAPPKIAGHSLLGAMQGRETGASEAYSETYYPAQFGWSPLRAVRQAGTKYIEAPKAELYDLRRDPGELRNLRSQQPELAAGMKQRLTGIAGASGKPGAGRSPMLDPEEIERLAALGYVSGPSGSRRSAELADPKDKLRIFQLISRAGQAAANGQCASAIPLLEQVLREEKGMAAAHLLLGRCRYNEERFEVARSDFEKVLARNPDDLQALFFVAACDYYLKRLEGAEVGFRRLLSKEPGYLPAQKYLGFVYEAKGEIPRAIVEFQRASQMAPGDEECHLKLGFLMARQSRFQEAVSHFRKALAINPGNAATHYNLGLAYLKNDDREHAESELAEACRLDRKFCKENRQ